MEDSSLHRDPWAVGVPCVVGAGSGRWDEGIDRAVRRESLGLAATRRRTPLGPRRRYVLGGICDTCHTLSRSHTVPSNDPDLERFLLLLNGPAIFQAMATACDLDVWAAMASDSITLEELASATGLKEDRVRVITLALSAAGLVVHEGRAYRLSGLARRLFDETDPANWRQTILGIREFQYPAYAHLTDSLREEAPIALDRQYPGSGRTLYDRLTHYPASDVAYQQFMAPWAELFARELFILPDFADRRHLLDVGGGTGTAARAFLRHWPAATATVVDKASVVDEIQADDSGRLRAEAIDFLEDELVADVDSVLFFHVLEPWGEDVARKLLSRAFSVLPSGGRVYLYGMTSRLDGTGGPLSARLAIHLATLATGTGFAHPVEDYTRWLLAEGFRSVAELHDLPYEHGLAVGEKP
jgi:hypothetical protein